MTNQTDITSTVVIVNGIIIEVVNYKYQGQNPQLKGKSKIKNIDESI